MLSLQQNRQRINKISFLNNEIEELKYIRIPSDWYYINNSYETEALREVRIIKLDDYVNKGLSCKIPSVSNHKYCREDYINKERSGKMIDKIKLKKKIESVTLIAAIIFSFIITYLCSSVISNI